MPEPRRLRRSVCDHHRARGADALANSNPAFRALGLADTLGNAPEGTNSNSNRNADASDRTEPNRHASDRTNTDALANPWW